MDEGRKRVLLTKILTRQWVSQADAAEMRGVTRQAIARLVKKGRFTTLSIAGKILLRGLKLSNSDLSCRDQHRRRATAPRRELVQERASAG